MPLRIYLFLLLALVVVSFSKLYGQPFSGLQSNRAKLQLLHLNDRFGVAIQLSDSESLYQQLKPMALEIVEENNFSYWVEGAYDNIIFLNDSTLQCSGSLTSKNSSLFTFEDVYSTFDNHGTFEVKRTVKVLKSGVGDMGFSTRLAFQHPTRSKMTEYEFFVPSIWYKNNWGVSKAALANNYEDQHYWFREDRLPLPIIMLRNIKTGLTFSLFHKDADGSTFAGEDGLARLIDGRMKFAAMGMQNNQQPLIGILYPGSEGERTGVFGMSERRKWAYRNHPVSTGYTQDYKVLINLSFESDYRSALQHTWNRYYEVQHPPLYKVDLLQVYQQQIQILDRYWQSINGVAGLPFRIHLNGQIDSADYNYNMGFVGQQIGNAALLIREGIQSSSSNLRKKGVQMLDFWAQESLSPAGIPRIWYDPKPQTWRSIPTHLRNIGDGMSSLLYAWNVEKKQGINHETWLQMVIKVADWLLMNQQVDGSFPQQYNFLDGQVIDSSKNNTSNVIPFLVDLYFITQDEKYHKAVTKAGNFIYQEIHQKFNYAGGAADNPNVPDKEAISMALRGFLALYDLDKSSHWLEAAKQAVYYYQTWVYAWELPLLQDDPYAIFPKTRSVTGLSLIATANNASDTYAAVDAFHVFRVYLYTLDKNLLHFSKLLLYNTKQYINWDVQDPIPGFATGFLGEALTVTVPRGRGVHYYLPWQTYNLLEPMIHFKDVFGSFNLNDIQQQDSHVLHEAHRRYAKDRGFENNVLPEIRKEGNL